MEVLSFEPIFPDRFQAGELLGAALDYLKEESAAVMAVPLGGVPVALPVARRLGAPLDVVVSQRLVLPFRPEVSLGAVTADGTLILNDPLVAGLELGQDEVDAIAKEARMGALRQESIYRENRPFPELGGRTVVLVDDGLTSGHALLAAVYSLRKYAPARVLVGVPAASLRSLRMVRPHVDEIIALVVRDAPQVAAASFYERFPQLSDHDAAALLDQAVLVLC